MYKLIRMAVFALPLAGGVAWAQGSGTSGSAGAPGSAMTPPVTDDTRSPVQRNAGRMDDAAPAMPGDATKPVDIPNRVDERSSADTSGMTTPGSGATDQPIHKDKTKDSASIDRRSDVDVGSSSDQAKPKANDDSSKVENKSLDDSARDQLDSDK